MLTYKIPSNKILKTEETIEPINDIKEINGELYIQFDSTKVVLREGDEIIFRRFNLPDIAFQDTRVIKKIINGSTFVIDSFPMQRLAIDSASVLDFYPYPGAAEKSAFLSFSLNENHNIISKKEKGISESIKGIYNSQEDLPRHKRCVGDYVRYDMVSLFVANGINEKGNYEFGTERSNARQSVYYEGEINGVLSNVFAPLNEKGADDRRWLLCEINDSAKNAWKIADKWAILGFKVEDERFIVKGEGAPESGYLCSLVSGSTISKVGISVCIDGFISENFETNMYQEDNMLNMFVEEAKEKSKNGALDYEKQRFTPVDGNQDDFSELRFNLFFRSRENEYKDWRATGDKWNYENEGNAKDGDLLGYLGFNDDDVYYRKKKLEKSFLRLSFYDTPYRTNQVLLYTSTIFIDSSKLFGKYIQAIKNGIIPSDAEDASGYVFTPETDLRCNFSVKDKFDKTDSSEGFYLYMFPAFVGESGSTEIYMKAEFYHAKYGYVIPLVFRDEPKKGGYWEGEGEEGKVNMAQLFSDMYIPIKVYNDGMYRWELPYMQEDDIISINLFEPKVN